MVPLLRRQLHLQQLQGDRHLRPAERSPLATPRIPLGRPVGDEKRAPAAVLGVGAGIDTRPSGSLVDSSGNPVGGLATIEVRITGLSAKREFWTTPPDFTCCSRNSPYTE